MYSVKSYFQTFEKNKHKTSFYVFFRKQTVRKHVPERVVFQQEK
jgi:hypothetical protein